MGMMPVEPWLLPVLIDATTGRWLAPFIASLRPIIALLPKVCSRRRNRLSGRKGR